MVLQTDTLCSKVTNFAQYSVHAQCINSDASDEEELWKVKIVTMLSARARRATCKSVCDIRTSGSEPGYGHGKCFNTNTAFESCTKLISMQKFPC